MKAMSRRSRRIGTQTCQSSISPSSPQSNARQVSCAACRRWCCRRFSGTVAFQLRNRSSIALQNLNIMSVQVAVGFQESHINGVRQNPEGFDSQPPMDLLSTAQLVGTCCWLKQLRCYAKYEKGCELLSIDLSNVVEIRSCRRGKETRGG